MKSNISGICLLAALTLSIFLSSCNEDEPMRPTTSYYSIRGQVFSAKNPSAYMQGVIVTTGYKSDTTDSFGRFYFKNVAGGSIKISFRYPNFRNIDTLISLIADTSISAGLKRELSDIFPNDLGYTWRYLVTNTVLGKTSQDTVTVKIISGGYSGNSTVWEYQGHSLFRSPLYTVTVINDTALFNGNIEYIFPLSIGKDWHMPFRTIDVRAIQTVTTKAGKFENCYFISQEASLGIGKDSRGYWFAPGIGLVQDYYYYFSMSEGAKEENWQLIDYKLE